MTQVNPFLDPEQLYLELRDWLQEEKGLFIPDEIDDQLGDICRAIFEGTANNEGS